MPTDPRDAQIAALREALLLAMDGFWRHGGDPRDILTHLRAKQAKNFARKWNVPTDGHAVEHVREEVATSRGIQNWRLERNGLFLGHFIADELRLDAGTLYAYRSGKRIGSVASGAGLSWKEAPLTDLLDSCPRCGALNRKYDKCPDPWHVPAVERNAAPALMDALKAAKDGIALWDANAGLTQAEMELIIETLRSKLAALEEL